MKAALHRIFWKNLMLLLILALVFVGFKCITVKNSELLRKDYEYLDIWALECMSMTDDDLTSYINTLVQRLDDDKTFRMTAEWDVQEILISFGNRKDMQRLISFAHTGEGVLPTGLPPNYLKLQDFYKHLEVPSIINEQPLDLYFSYQRESVVPILVLILGAVFWGTHFETEIYKYTRTTSTGKHYSRTMTVTLMLIGVLFFCANELFDLWRSGLLERRYIWKSSIQSYSPFSNTQINANIGTVLCMAMLSKLLGVHILSRIVCLIARYKKSVKTTSVWAFLLLIALLFLGKAIENTQIYPLLQIGIIDWKQLITNTTILLPLNVAALPIGLVLTVAIELGLLCRHSILHKDMVRL